MPRILDLLLSFFYLLQFLQSSNASNAQNYFCRGCAAVVETTWQRTLPIIQKFSASQVAGSTQSAKFDIEGKFVQTLCGVGTDGLSMFSDKHPLRYISDMRDTCKQIIEKNSKVISTGLAGTFPELSHLYDRVKEICVDTMDLCDPPVEAPFVSGSAGLNQCDYCKMVVDDMKDVLTRSKFSPNYLSKKHVWNHFDEGCSMLQARYPRTISSKLLEVCDEMIDEFEELIAESFLSRSETVIKDICGKKGTGWCKGQKGEWDVPKNLKSPWSQQPESNNYDL